MMGEAEKTSLHKQIDFLGPKITEPAGDAAKEDRSPDFFSGE